MERVPGSELAGRIRTVGSEAASSLCAGPELSMFTFDLRGGQVTLSLQLISIISNEFTDLDITLDSGFS